MGGADSRSSACADRSPTEPLSKSARGCVISSDAPREQVDPGRVYPSWLGIGKGSEGRSRRGTGSWHSVWARSDRGGPTLCLRSVRENSAPRHGGGGTDYRSFVGSQANAAFDPCGLSFKPWGRDRSSSQPASDTCELAVFPRRLQPYSGTVRGQRSQQLDGPCFGPAWASWTGPALFDSGRRIGPAANLLGAVLGERRVASKGGATPVSARRSAPNRGRSPFAHLVEVVPSRSTVCWFQPAQNGGGTR
jgi:hypothetical protein